MFVRNNMNILLISLYSLERNTSVSISNINITQGLQALGHRITWVMPNWPRCETVFDASQVRIVRIPGHDLKRDLGYVRNRLNSHFGMLGFTRSYLRKLKQTHVPDEFFDVVISTSDPKTSHIFTSRLLKHIRYGRWIQHWGDPLLGDITRNFWWPRWYVKYYENRILRKADKVIYVTPFTCEAQRKEYPGMAEKIAFIPLPADMCATVTDSRPGLMRIAYLGDYNARIRNLWPLYLACTSMEDASLTVAGFGPKFPPAPNVSVHSRIPQEQALKIENEADVLFCACNKRGTQIPGKILYKASSDKHILIAVESELKDEMNRYFDSYNRFTVCENTPESIVAALESLPNRPHDYSTPDCLLPVNVAKAILQ